MLLCFQGNIGYTYLPKWDILCHIVYVIIVTAIDVAVKSIKVFNVAMEI